MAVPVPIRTGVSVEEYLAWEREQTDKHEYLHGQIFAMAGGSPRHNRLCVKISAALEAQLGTKCHILSSDQRVRAQKRQYVYPDVTVVCGALTIESGDVLTNPTIVVEVLSASTEHHDRGAKWDGYRRNWSLTDYVLVAQDVAKAEHFRRDDTGWHYEIVETGGVVKLANGATLEIDALFAGVFELKGDPPTERPDLDD